MNILIVPINARLIELSLTIAKPLIQEGHNVRLAKTCSLGQELSGWEQFPSVPYEVLNIDALNCKHKSNFFRYIYRAFLGYFFLKNYIPKEIDLFIIFHDSYADGEIFLKYAKRNKIKTLLFQEGFHSRVNKYNLNIYDAACFLRNKLFPFLFSNEADGLNSDFVAVWSDDGMKADLIAMGRKSERIYTVGNPFSVSEPELIQSDNNCVSLKNALIAHQPLWPRFADHSWETNKYIEVIENLLLAGYKVTFKVHPRFIKNQKVLNIINCFSTKFGKSNPNLIIDTSSSRSENLIPNTDLFITFFSMTAYSFLKNNIPTIFLQPQRNEYSILKYLGSKNRILYFDDKSNIYKELKYLKEQNFNYCRSINTDVVNILFGDNYYFNDFFQKAIRHIAHQSI